MAKKSMINKQQKTPKFSLVRKITEADTADAVLSQNRVGSSADAASRISSRRELRRLLLFIYH